ncbi:hypothetical protein KKH43_00700 [Patescibacteria group bacterium]|nr:hypothetical protein [Patescibacteria group bacterium]
MAKSALKIEARRLRKQGYSLKEIISKLNIAKSTVSVWCRDIELTKEQIERLQKKQNTASLVGRLKGAKKQQQNRLNKIEHYKKLGNKDIGKLSKRDFFVSGLALYWGEGSKKENRVGFSNSDPHAIQFMEKWLIHFLKVDKTRFSLQIGINEIHRQRESEVKKYWSSLTGVPYCQFVKTSFKQVQNQKIYKNNQNHFGTLRITITKSSELQYKIWGWLKALSETTNKPG